MANKRIIALVINDLNFDRRMIRICSSLAEAGYKVTLLGRRLPDSLPLKNEIFEQKRIKCLFNKGPFFYLEFNIRALLFLLFNSFDIVNSTDADTLIAAGLASILKKKTHVHDAHEYFVEVPELLESPLKRKMWRMIEKLFIPRTRLAYTVSYSIADVYSSIYKKKFEVIMNVPFKSPLAVTDTSKENILMYQGALNLGRGIEATILAMHQIDGIFWIAGEGDLSKFLRLLVQKEGLEKKVVFLGMLDPNELRGYTLKAKVGVNLCEPLGLSYYYALSNKGFDYLHAGLPSVTNDFPEYQVLNAKYETMILTEANPEKIANSVNRLFNDEILYERLRNNCLIASEEYNWQKESVKLISLYEAL